MRYDGKAKQDVVVIYVCVLFRYTAWPACNSPAANFTSQLNLNSVNQLIFVMVKRGVLFEVRTEFLNNI
jgi:hypothetical protein